MPKKVKGKENPNSKRRSVLKKLVRFCTFMLLGIVILLVLVYLVFRLNKGGIERKLLRIVHTLQPGEILVQDIDLSLFAQFPKVSLKLEDVTYFEHHESERKAEELPVAELEDIYVAVEILKLLRGDLVLTEITLKKGRINIIKYPDKSVNLLNAIGVDLNLTKDTTETSDQASEGTLNLDVVILEDVYLSYENSGADYKLDVLINHLSNSLYLEGSYLDCRMVPDMRLLGLQTQGQKFLQNIDVGMDLEFRFDMEELSGQIAPSELQVESAFIGVEGSFDLKDDGFLDLKFDSLINDASLLSLLFEEEVLSRNKANLKKGEVFLKGYVKGNFKNHFPSAEVTFGANDIHLDVLQGSGPIQGLGFKGYFATGEAQDLSEATLKIEDLAATLPGGSLQGSVEVNNLKRPEVSLQCEAKANIRGFDNIFKINFLKDLRGILTINADVQGTIDIENKRVLNEFLEARVNFENIAFRVPEWQQSIDSLSGVVNFSKDLLKLNDVFVKSGDSDLLVNGETSGLISHLRNEQTDITANIRIKSELLKLSDVLVFDPSLAKSSDEEISGLEADLIISTTTEGLSDFALIPWGSLTINSLSAGLKNFTDVKILSGRFDVNQDTITVYELQAKIGDSDIRLSADLVNPRGLSSKDTPVDMGLTFVLDSSLMRVNDVFTYREQTYFLDSLKEESFSNLHLQGELWINNQELFANKTIPDFHLKINEVDWSLAAFPDPFEDLSVDISFQDEDLIIRNIQGHFGENDFAINGIIENVLHKMRDVDASKSTTLHLKSQNLNLSDLDDLVKSIALNTPETRDKSESSLELSPLNLSLDIDSLKWSTISAAKVKGELITRGITQLVLHSEDESKPMLTIDMNGSLKTENLILPDLVVPKFSMAFSGKDRFYDLQPSSETVFGTRGTGNIHLDFSRPVRAIRVQYEVENFHIGNLLRRFGEEPLMTGDMDFLIDLTAVGNDTAALNKSLTGKVALDGYELTLHGIDVDDLLAKFKRSQEFNLVDLGAFMMAGPIGAVVTKGFNFAALLNLDPEAESTIPRFTSQWELKGGMAEASDVALVTLKSRVALKGEIDLVQKRFNDFSLAVVDKNGCALVNQSLNGPFTEPEMSGITAVEALLAPVFNIFKVVAFGACPAFYSGSLEHPTK